MITMKLFNHDHIIYADDHSTVITYDGTQNHFMILKPQIKENMAISRLNYIYCDGCTIPPSRMNPIDDPDFKKHSDLFHNAVLFIPAAQSTALIPNKFWNLLNQKYQHLGIKTFTNYNGLEYEQMIPGTLPISTSISDLARIAPYFRQVIALRSGACDLIAQTTANLSILYNQEILNGAVVLEPNDIKWDSIHKLVNRENLHSYQYLPNLENKLIDNLIKQLT